MTFKDSITKEEINELPREEFTGEIIIVDSLETLQECLSVLNTADIVGFDTETRPSFVKGGGMNKVALLQLSTSDVCYLIRLNIIDIPKELKAFLENKAIKKVGISLHDDYHALRRRINLNPAGFADLQQKVANFGIAEKSLQKIYAIVFGKKISKSQRLTNWEAPILTNAQKQYAALDAWACLQLWEKLFGK